MGLGFPIEKQS